MSWNASRKIIHIDMDAFYAAVEQRDDPALKGKPVIVGGDPYGRGVVSTASYEARKFGIRSAMPAVTARRLCPQGVFLRPHFSKYRLVSSQIMAILRQHTDRLEPASLDEAYLDVTKNRFKIKDPAKLAVLIKQTILAATKLTASAGVAPNPFLAKVASDFKKPDGLVVVLPGTELDFLEKLPVRKIPGVGPVTEKALRGKGIECCGDLMAWSELRLCRVFGKTGVLLYQRSRGVDPRELEPDAPAKQTSTEETFPADTKDLGFLKARLQAFAEAVFEEVEANRQAGRTVVLKVKYHDFESITRSHTLKQVPQNWQAVYGIAEALLEKKTLAGRKPIRLIGLGLAGLGTGSAAPNVPSDLFTG